MFSWGRKRVRGMKDKLTEHSSATVRLRLTLRSFRILSIKKFRLWDKQCL